MCAVICIVVYLLVLVLSYVATIFYLGATLEERDYEHHWNEFNNGSSDYDRLHFITVWACIFWPIALAICIIYNIILHICMFVSDCTEEINRFGKSLRKKD